MRLPCASTIIVNVAIWVRLTRNESGRFCFRRPFLSPKEAGAEFAIERLWHELELVWSNSQKETDQIL